MWHDLPLDVSDDFGLLYRPKANDLPQILPRFFVPLLEDKPQNPILEALNLESITSNLPPRLFQPHLLPQELTALSLNISQAVQQQPETKVEEIWTNALIRNRGDRVRFIISMSLRSFPGDGYNCRMVYCHGIDYGPRTQLKHRPPDSCQSKTRWFMHLLATGKLIFFTSLIEI
jgi:hypothetical protein